MRGSEREPIIQDTVEPFPFLTISKQIILPLQVCIRCHEECVECVGKGASSCSKCKHYYYDSEKPYTCVPSCRNDTHYANSQTKQCEPCNDACRLVESELPA